MLWDLDVESEAESILTAHGFEVDEPSNVESLARSIVGCARVVTVPGLRVPARYTHATRTIEVRYGLSPRRRRYVLAHELAERHLFLHLYDREDIERLADALAAALVIPRRAMQAAVRVTGRRLPDLSALLGASQSVVSLRLAEVTGSPLALVTPRCVHVRGDEWGWPSESAVRRLVRGPLPEGVVRLEITDAARRWVLAAA